MAKSKKGIYIKGKDIEMIKVALERYSKDLHTKYETAFEENKIDDTSEGNMDLMLKIRDILENIESKENINKEQKREKKIIQ